jgi:4-amino-4-deoxy-L-arabinose transferase-like glycosyltransferase
MSISLDYAKFIRNGEIKSIAWYRNNFEHPSLGKIIYALGLISNNPVEQFYPKDFELLKPVSIDAQRYVFAVRRLSAIFGVLTVFFSALLNPLAALFLAVHTTAVHFTSVYYLDAVASFFASLSMFSYLHWKNKRPPNFHQQLINTGSDFWLWVSFAFIGLTAASKYVYALIGIVIILDYFLDMQENHQFSKTAFLKLGLLGLGSIILFYVFNPMIWRKPVALLVESLQYHFTYSVSENVARYGYPFWQPLIWLTGQQEWYKPAFLIQLDPVIMFLAALGLPSLYKKWRPIFFWLVIGLVFLLIWNTKWPQYIMMIVTPLCFSAAEGVRLIIFKPVSLFLNKRRGL